MTKQRGGPDGAAPFVSGGVRMLIERWRSRIVNCRVACLVCFLLFSALAVLAARADERPGAGAASALMARCEAVLYAEKRRLGLVNEALDPERTGLIGVEFSPLTTSLGRLSDKRASSRPAMADVVAAYLRRAGVKKGDWISVNASGSFPGFSLATLCAAESLGVNTQVVFSYGSSMYGGTDPGFTFPVILDLLNRAGLLSARLRAIAPGGARDRMAETLLESPFPTVTDLMSARPEERIEETTLEDAIARRLRIFAETPSPVACFVSCGGPGVSLGRTESVLKLPHGLVATARDIPEGADRGLLFEFLARGVSVVHLLNVRGVCGDFGLPYEEIPDP